MGAAAAAAKQPVFSLAQAVTGLTGAMAKNVSEVLTLQGDEVRHVLDHADDGRVAPLIRAKVAEFALGQVAAARAAAHGAGRLLQRRHEGRQPRGLLHQQVQGDALRGAVAEPRELF